MKFVHLFFLLVTLALHAEIVEIKALNEVRTYIKPDTLIIFDIDNTLIEPIQELGSDQWFSYLYTKLLTEGTPKPIALEKAVNTWIAVQTITQVKPVEPNNDRIITALQNEHFPILGLTVRSSELSSTTIEQLSSVSIDLSRTAPFSKENRQGIIFTSGQPKGKALFNFLEKAHYTPKHILVIDDKLEHLKNVEASAAEKKISFTGLRYGYLDRKVGAFNPELTEIQFHHFKQILSDEKAKEMLKAQKNTRKVSS